jgi:CheY-like chemotaxis protein
MKPISKPVDILLIEDNPADVRLVQEVLREAKVHHSLHLSQDGEEAMSYLRREKRYGDAPRPDLILLDLHLPGKDGYEVLAEIKADEDLKRIPVVVLTVSEAKKDILKSYQLHANCYITKPVDLEQFITVVESIENFWLSIVKLPSDVER